MNICIVDDDKYVVEKIVEGIEWKKWDIEGVFAAYNVKQAKDILSTMQIDILLSDIEMPQGSGLELLEWVRERKLPVECIYLSSYAHFAYAQKALELHSRGYLLKPVSNKELSSVLENLVGQMKLERAENGEDKQREKEWFWRNILLEKEPAQKPFPECKSHAEKYYGQDLVLLSLLRIFQGMDRKKLQDDAVLYLTLKHTAEEFLRKKDFPVDIMLQYSDDCFLIVMRNCSKEQGEMEKGLGELLSHIEEQMHVPACVYIGKQTGIKGCKEQMIFLQQVIREGVPGKDGLLFCDCWTGQNAVYKPPRFTEWEQKMMYSQDMSGVLAEILGYVDGLYESGEVNVKVFGSFKADLQQMVFHFMMEKGIAMNQIFEPGEYDYYCDKASWTIRDIKDFISILFKKLKAVIKVENTGENVVEQIMHYIDENLAGDLSRATLAAQVYISEDYLSKKFAMHTGMSIPGYVSARRMEKACDYFKNTLRSVSEVAMLVGYSNFSYFSKTFRDYAGCTPNEYRIKNNRSNLTKI